MKRVSANPAVGRSGAVTLTSDDEKLIRRTARRIGVQVAVASAFAVAVVAVLALTLIHHHPGALPQAAGLPHVEPAGDRDVFVRNALLAAAGVGIVIAGLVGFAIARRAVRPLGQALSLQRRFVADAGHELRTPLTVLHTRAQLLARRIPAGDPARQMADQLLDDSRMLSEIVDELLLSATMSANPGLGEEFDPAELLTDVANRMRVLADDSQVTLRSTADSSLLIRGSRPALRRALIALVDNAISHSMQGGTVRLAAAAQNNLVLLTVTDEGDGLAPGSSELVWTRFSRGSGGDFAHSSSRPIGNRRYGLGLALVREIATAHGGTVALTNAGDGENATIGAIATLSIPLAGRTLGVPAPPRQVEQNRS